MRSWPTTSRSLGLDPTPGCRAAATGFAAVPFGFTNISATGTTIVTGDDSAATVNLPVGSRQPNTTVRPLR